MTFVPFDWYWIVGDTNPTTQVYSTVSGAYVANNAAAFLTWLADAIKGAASGDGSSEPIISAADNGAGKTRLLVGSTSRFATGQRFYFGANGVQQITVIDATHIDLTGLNFSSYVATKVMQGATLIDTDALLRITLNNFAFKTYQTDANTLSQSTNVTLTNPLRTKYLINITGGTNHNVTLPAMNAPNSVPIGFEFTIFNASTRGYRNNNDEYLAVYANDGTTLIAYLNAQETIKFTLKSNATANGTLDAVLVNAHQATTTLQYLRANTVVGTPTQIQINMSEVLMHDQYGQSLLSTSGLRTCDITVAGPTVNGRDQAGAFAAGNTIHFYAIGSLISTTGTIASLADPQNFVYPTLPTGFTHFAYLFSVVLEAGPNIPKVFVRGHEVFFRPAPVPLVNGAAVVETFVSVAAWVPTIATSFQIGALSMGITTNGAGNGSDVVDLRHTSTILYVQGLINVWQQATEPFQAPIGGYEFPNQNNGFYYQHTIVAGTAPVVTTILESYKCPNGA